MKKIKTYVLIGLFLSSIIGINAVLSESTETQILQLSQKFGLPTISEDPDFSYITLDHTNTWIRTPGHPFLPAYQKTFTFPLETKIENILVDFSAPQHYYLEKPIIPTSTPLPLTENMPTKTNNEMDQSTYTQNSFYPETTHRFFTGSGILGKERNTYLTLICYPVQYQPTDNLITVYNQVDISIFYDEPAEPVSFIGEYDLLIIAPEKFSKHLEPLIEHKQGINISTLFVSTEDIYQQYSGRDKPEQIKYCIKDMIETHGILYVLLVGGLDSYVFATSRDDANQGTKDWHVPVRYTNVYDGGSVQDPGYISDLYFSDIYDGDMNFSSWDSNGNDIFAEWRGNKDIIDLKPDVYVGRLPCRNALEVKIMVNKIMKYESGPAPSQWFNKFVVVGGDTFDDVHGTNVYEGEAENQKCIDYMPGFTPVKIWGSNRNTSNPVPIPRDIIPTISKGCGFLAFAGHGSPERWNSHWPEGFDEERFKGLLWYHMPFFYNGNKVPVCVVGGCHNSQFNITALSCFKGGMWVFGPIPECWSWLLTRKAGGGAIATIGNTGLGYGKVGNNGDLDGDGIDDPDCVEALGGYIETQFFKAYGIDNYAILGEAWGAAVSTYHSVYPPMLHQLDCKTMQQWVLLGDPSLQIGGL